MKDTQNVRYMGRYKRVKVHFGLTEKNYTVALFWDLLYNQNVWGKYLEIDINPLRSS